MYFAEQDKCVFIMYVEDTSEQITPNSAYFVIKDKNKPQYNAKYLQIDNIEENELIRRKTTFGRSICNG